MPERQRLLLQNTDIVLKTYSSESFKLLGLSQVNTTAKKHSCPSWWLSAMAQLCLGGISSSPFD